MLQRIPLAMLSALRAFRASLSPQPLGPVRPVWDNGVNYDVPTFLRRGAA
ncbi:hypothetical protein [Methylococcus sp. EFPC2]|nr:hypothetical protein [Methylococcus sp. EFPC2]QSA96239.1 hypothetical protein JWZ97_13515 [Methylococcus sp. EFPC2]